MRYSRSMVYDQKSINQQAVKDMVKQELLRELSHKLQDNKIYTIRLSSESSIDEMSMLFAVNYYADIERAKEMEIVVVTEDELLSRSVPEDKSFWKRIKTAFSYIFSKKFRTGLEQRFKDDKDKR
mgnify:CR=1 FL=1